MTEQFTQSELIDLRIILAIWSHKYRGDHVGAALAKKIDRLIQHDECQHVSQTPDADYNVHMCIKCLEEYVR